MRMLRFLLRKEFTQIFRDPALVRMLFMMPIVQLIILSNAATFELKRARMHIVDQDHSSASRGVIDRLTASGRFVAEHVRVRRAVPSEVIGEPPDRLGVACRRGFLPVGGQRLEGCERGREG